MRLKIVTAAMAAGAIGFVAAAYAQNYYPPVVPVISQIDAIPIVRSGQPSAQQQFANPAQITSQMGYRKVSPVTGYTYTFGNSQSMLVFTGAVTPLSGTVTFAPLPSDGANECIYSQGGISTLNLAAGATGQTVRNAVTSLAALAKVCYLYSAADGFWDRN